jgi:hypothetical protein
VVIIVALRHVPETHDPTATGRVDVLGAALSALGLAAITYAIIAAPAHGAGSATVLVTGGIGVVALAGFGLAEARQSHPMLPLGIFASRQFSAANAVTFAVYAGFGGVFFLLAVQLQVVAGFSPLAAGTALLPVTVLMLLLSARFGQLAQRIGPRVPMTAGPLICVISVMLMHRIGPHADYLRDVLPAIVVLGLGLSMLVAPLTATVLAAIGAEHAGVASGVNNAVARAAGLVSVATLPAVTGLSGRSYEDPVAFAHGFGLSLDVAAGLLVAGAIMAAATIRSPAAVDSVVTAADGRLGTPAATSPPAPSAAPLTPLHCAVDGPPLAVPRRR